MANAEIRSDGYLGPDRRHNRVFVTRNTEYHCRDDVCVAVRDLRTGQFKKEHPALGRHMSGGIHFVKDGSIESFTKPGDRPAVGDSLLFSEGKLETELITSPLSAIRRPPKEIVSRYSQ